jgi:hypothetical protein
MLGSLWAILLLTTATESIENLWPRKSILITCGWFPKLHYANTVTTPREKKACQVLFDCGTANIATLVGEDVKDTRVWIVLIIVLLGLATMRKHEATFKNLLIPAGWAMVAIQCAVNAAPGKQWIDREILLIAAEAAVSHFALTLDINFDPNFH